jgi:7,8-dihydroneopterin aldolase/epimerase/oxygenase
MSDRILLDGMVFRARHGVADWEKVELQRFEVDVELAVDLQPAGLEDELTLTVDYGEAYRTIQQIVVSTTYNLIEALAEAIANELLAEHATVGEVVVRVRKPEVRLGGPLAYAGVEIRRQRSG